VFLSYHWPDHAPVERTASALRDIGINPFLDRWYLHAGQPWPQALEAALADCEAVAVFVGPCGLGPWQHKEITLAMSREQGFPVIPILLPGSKRPEGFLNHYTRIDMRRPGSEQEAVEKLSAAIGRQPPPTGPAPAPQVCPYPGLLHFREEDAAIYFGRDRAVADLHARVREHRFTMVVGASGAGKSSLVRAGLPPRLRRDTHPAWEIATIVPGRDPFAAVAAVLVGMLEPGMTEVDRLAESRKLRDHLASDAVKLDDTVDRALAKRLVKLDSTNAVWKNDLAYIDKEIAKLRR
jgi:hypothetical protein